MWGSVALGENRSGKMGMMNVILVTGELLNLTFLKGRKEKKKRGRKQEFLQEKKTTQN